MSVVGRTYGWKQIDLAVASRRIGDALSIDLELRESSFRGGDYYDWTGPSGGEINLQRNFRDDEGELDEPDFQEYEVLLLVSALPVEVLDKLGDVPGLDLLESHVYPVSPE